MLPRREKPVFNIFTHDLWLRTWLSDKETSKQLKEKDHKKVIPVEQTIKSGFSTLAIKSFITKFFWLWTIFIEHDFFVCLKFSNFKLRILI